MHPLAVSPLLKPYKLIPFFFSISLNIHVCSLDSLLNATGHFT